MTSTAARDPTVVILVRDNGARFENVHRYDIVEPQFARLTTVLFLLGFDYTH